MFVNLNMYADVISVPTTITHSILADENIVKESQINTDTLGQKATVPSTNVCIYTDGATVNVLIRGDRVYAHQQFRIRNLSSAVGAQSIIIHCPDTIDLEEYQVVDSDPVQPRKKATAKAEVDLDEVTPKELRLVVHNADKFNAQDFWRIQYFVRKVFWTANHVIEFSNDWNYITFRTILDVENLSGIDFENASIQFFDCPLPVMQETSLTPANVTQPSAIYQTDHIRTLATNQKKSVVWSHAKRIAISQSNGLFVGGQYLKKMDGVAYPQIERWISFPNLKEVGLGMPLPNGKVTLYYNKHNFGHLVGFASMGSVTPGGNATIRMPPFPQKQLDRKFGEAYSALTATLTQESFRDLTPTLSEGRYKLSLQNLKNVKVQLLVTVNNEGDMKCSVTRETMQHQKNTNGEITWVIEIPPKGSKELRYDLSIQKRI